jgi:hypothetical protein
MKDPEDTDPRSGFVHVGTPPPSSRSSRGSGDRVSDQRIDDIWRFVERLDKAFDRLSIQVAHVEAAGEVWGKVFNDLSVGLRATDTKIGEVRQDIANLRVEGVREAGTIRIEAAGEKGENKWPHRIVWILVAGLITSVATNFYNGARIAETLQSSAVYPPQQQHQQERR